MNRLLINVGAVFGIAVTVLVLTSCGGGGGPTAPTEPTTINLTGTWQGTWRSVTGQGGSVTISMTQSGNSLSGTASVTGSPCFTTGSLSGSVSGNTVVFGMAFGGGQQANYNGAVSTSGTSASGTHSVSGGACNGDTGSWNVTKIS